MRRFVVSAALAVAVAPSVAGQALTLTPRPDAEDGLPASIRVFDVARAGTSLRASLVRADLSDDDWVLEAVLSDEGSETVASFARDEGVFAVINGGFFGGGQLLSLVLDGGAVASPNVKALNRSGTTFYPTRGAVGVTDARVPDVAWVYDVGGVTYAYPAPSPNAPGVPQPQPTALFPEGGGPWNVTTAIGGGPVLVQNGAVAITYDEEVMFGSGVDLTASRARTAVGYTSDQELLLVAVAESNGLTLGALAQLMADLGAIEALNLDGGGSTAMTAAGVGLVASTRPVPSALRLRDSSATGTVDENVFDTGDASYRESGDWFESANAPFAAGTPSRLNQAGTGEDRAVFTFEGIEAGAYSAEAWWTASGNRAVDTPFTVYHDGVGTTVEADQTQPASAGVWNQLGVFEVAPGDSLVVTDDATGSGTDVFVVVDAVRLVGPLVTQTVEAGAGAPGTLRVGPNPTRAGLTVDVAGVAPGAVRVQVIDALGRVVRHESVRSNGEARVELDVRGLRPGPYVVRVLTAQGALTRTVTVLR